MNNYLPYAKEVITDRALPCIDGLKPVQRRVLVMMYEYGLLTKDFTKSQKIVGLTMGLHPHGDSPIYEAMQVMTTGYDGINEPYIVSKGAFGKKYSRDLQCSAPRYTNVRLAPIVKEMFEGIDENAVDFVDNYDETDKEPVLLPVKFPNILVNSNPGVAVAMSSNIPTFSLVNVCKATAGVVSGRIKTPEELADVLGTPEFPTGGFLHASKESLEELSRTGKGRFMISGSVERYENRIVVTEIPFKTTAEDIMDAIEDAVREKRLTSVVDVNDEIGRHGLRIVIRTRKGEDTKKVLRQLNIMTPLRTSISYNTKFIHNGRCREVGLFELLEMWISFRREAIKRVFEFRAEENRVTEHKYSTWELIINDIAEVVSLIAKSNEQDAEIRLMKDWGLSKVQVDYLMGMQIRSITVNRASKCISDLKKVREKIAYYETAANDVNIINKVIEEEQYSIIEKYGKNNKTNAAPELDDTDFKPDSKVVSDEVVTVIFTNTGFVRRISSINSIMDKYVSKSGDEEVLRWTLKNNEYLLVFDRYGSVHKVLADRIDASNKAQMQDTLHGLAGLEKREDMVYVDVSGDYSGYFNLVYGNGRGVRVYYSKAKGKREHYKIGYDYLERGNYWITKENKFFMITDRRKAAYCNISDLGALMNRCAFKVANLTSKEKWVMLYEYSKLPSPDLIDLKKYNKPYPVLIRDDPFWIDEEAGKRAKEFIRREMNGENNH